MTYVLLLVLLAHIAFSVVALARAHRRIDALVQVLAHIERQCVANNAGCELLALDACQLRDQLDKLKRTSPYFVTRGGVN
jgi:hypothetical protein